MTEKSKESYGRTNPGDEARILPTQAQLETMKVGDIVTSQYDTHFMHLPRKITKTVQDNKFGSGWGVQMDDGYGSTDSLPPETIGKRPYSLLPESIWPSGLIDGAWALPVE
jgi:hypothetical protein